LPRGAVEADDAHRSSVDTRRARPSQLPVILRPALLLQLAGSLLGATPQAPAALTYDAQVTIAPDSGWIDAHVTLRYPVPAGATEGVALLLNRGLTLRSLDGVHVRTHAIRPSEYSPAWHQLEVTFSDDVSAGDTVTISLVYRGRPEMPGDGINRITPAWVELGLDSQWFPVVSTFAQAMTGEVRIGLPDTWTVVGSGDVAIEHGHHVLRTQVEQIDVAFTAAPRLQRVRTTTAAVHHRTMPEAAVQTVLRVAATCVDDLNARFGARTPFPEARLVLAERDGPGYARKNYIVLSTVNAAAADALQQFVCHEVAHFWTRSPGSFSPDHWMSEAFAEYAAAMVVRDRHGADAFARLRSRWDDTGASTGPVWTPTSTQRPSYQLMYRRAPALLAQLETRMGTERFAQLMGRYMMDGVTSTAVLLALVAEIGGADTAAWFRAALAS
jgi:hypothetical protein